jgi:predicted membrane protein
LKSRYVAGIILIILGVLFLLDEFDIFYFGDILRTYWPLLIVLYGLGSLFDKTKSKLFSAIVLVFGVIIQLNKLNYLNKGIMSYFLPSVLIIVGLNMIFESEKNKKKIKVDFDTSDFEKNTVKDNFISHTALFSGLELKVINDDFAGAKLNAIFGGIEIDLTNVKTTKNIIVIEANAVFGGIEINIPKDWNVKIEGTPLFGGYSMNHKRPFVENAPTVVFKGLALFGGVEIE